MKLLPLAATAREVTWDLSACKDATPALQHSSWVPDFYPRTAHILPATAQLEAPQSHGPETGTHTHARTHTHSHNTHTHTHAYAGACMRQNATGSLSHTHMQTQRHKSTGVHNRTLSFYPRFKTRVDTAQARGRAKASTWQFPSKAPEGQSLWRLRPKEPSEPSSPLPSYRQGN